MKSFVAVLLFALPALGQQFAMSGTVINSKTGEPIPRALVTINRLITIELVGPPEATVSRASTPVSKAAFTDPGGRFQFTNLVGGDYSITASRPQFVATPGIGSGGTEPIHLRSSIDNATVKLSPLGAITGTVTDQDGLPLPGVTIQILNSQVQDGFREVKSDRTVSTDDRGIYRTWNLAAGRYFVKAGEAGGAVEVVGAGTPISGDESFAPVYFGGAQTVESAAPVDLESGGEARADFRVQMESAWRIGGSLNGFTSRSPIRIELVNPSGDASAVRATVNAAVGRFAAGPVVPGSWTLRATQGTSVAETAFTVQASDLNSLALSLLPAGELRVNTRFTNSLPAGDDREPEGVLISRPGISHLLCLPFLVSRSSSLSTPRLVPKPVEDGSASIAEVPPGRYLVELTCNGAAYIRSAMSGNQDLAVDPILTILPGMMPAPIEITATWGGGSVQGTVKSAKARSILLVPQFPDAVGARLMSTFLDPEHPDDVQFNFTGLAPGSYSIWAFEDRDVEFRNPQFLRTLTGGVTVQIDGDAAKTVSIDSVMRP